MLEDHWKAVGRFQARGALAHSVVEVMFAEAVDAARSKDAEAHAAELAAKDAEIADLTRRLHWFTAYTPCHWTKGEIEYRTDCGHIAGPVSKVPDGKCNGCGRTIVVSVPA